MPHPPASPVSAAGRSWERGRGTGRGCGGGAAGGWGGGSRVRGALTLRGAPPSAPTPCGRPASPATQVHLGPRSEDALGCSAAGSGILTPAPQSCKAPWAGLGLPAAPCAFLQALHIPWGSELGPSAAPHWRPFPITQLPNPGQEGACLELTRTHRGAKLALASAPPTSPTHTKAREGPA